MKDEFNSMTAIAFNEHNKKYFVTKLIQPLVAEDFIKQLYMIYNSDKERGLPIFNVEAGVEHFRKIFSDDNFKSIKNFSGSYRAER